MTSFDDLKAKALDLAQAGAAKAKELTDIAKLNIANSAEEDTIRKAYIDLGKLYYAERGMAPEGAYVTLCEKITAAKQRLEENKAKIAEIKRAGNINDDDVAAYTCDCGCGCSCEDETVEAPAEEPIVVEPLADEKTDDETV
ncbi:serine proteinase [uncultured Intestinimonas sp.]|uniref:serine proteinase n=1 Tax=Intestinimonas sp. HCP28S3_D6 TaxID=3438942 RepID=UPI0025F8FA47|nr:serine proteinase [uncultured Intestinimonas sp.]